MAKYKNGEVRDSSYPLADSPKPRPAQIEAGKQAVKLQKIQSEADKMGFTDPADKKAYIKKKMSE